MTLAENLHRSELTVLERAEHIEEWRRLAAEKVSQVATPQPRAAGVRQAARELGVPKEEVTRARVIASMPEPLKQAARVAGVICAVKAIGFRLSAAPTEAKESERA